MYPSVRERWRTLRFPGISAVPVADPRAAARAPRRPGADRRRWWAAPAVLVLASSLLAVPAPPVMGVDGIPDHPARFSACVGPALRQAGFRDMEGSFAGDAANCLAHYGITFGTGPGTFSPGRVAPRRQMALFLVRAARQAGIEVPDPSEPPFTDLDVSDGSRAAISQVTALGLMEGTSPTTFDPHAPVTRGAMAVMLTRFLGLASIGPGGADIEKVAPDDDHFRDLSSESRATRMAIRKLYEMGVVKGTSAFAFSPSRPVNRAQMAVFISRALAHTNARPAGLVIQAAEAVEISEDPAVTLSISYRDRHRAPLAAKPVDVFQSTNPDKAIDDAGLCAAGYISPVVTGQACLMDTRDERTNASGNLSIDLGVGDAGELRVWAWTGSPWAMYSDETKVAAVIDIRTLNPVAALQVSDGMRPSARKLRFGDTVTFTFQLVDGRGDPVRKPGVKFSIAVEEWRNNYVFRDSTLSKVTGKDGSAQAVFRHGDPSKESGDVARLDLDVLDGGGLEVSDLTTFGLVAGDGRPQDRWLEWVDEEDEPTSMTLTLPDEYRVASPEVGIITTAPAKVIDQYGTGEAGETVTFTSSDTFVVPRGVDRTTDARGVATLDYRRNSASGATVWITARSGDLEATARQYWAARIPAGASGSGEVRVVDTDNDRAVVVAGADVWLVEYEATDRFEIDGAEVRVLTFEDALEVGVTLTFEIAPSASGANTFGIGDESA